MIRCVRLWTGQDNNSCFEEGWLDLQPGTAGDLLSGKLPAKSVSFQQTHPGGRVEWHTDPATQIVITLKGTLDFVTKSQQHFTLRPGDVLFTEDTSGSGHSWRLVDQDPWERVYVVLGEGASVPFRRQ